MAREGVPRLLVPSPSNSRFASLMATATQSESERTQKLARLQAQQQLESNRRKESELAEKEREKHDRWNKVLENHEKQVKAATQPAQVKITAVAPSKPKILQPVRGSVRKKANGQQRSMTFKKLLKEAAKIDVSTFKVGPKVKSIPKVPEKPRPMEKTQPIKPETKPSPRTTMAKSASPRPSKSLVERNLSSSTGGSVYPLPVKSQVKKIPLKPIKSAIPAKPVSKSSGKDAKSRLRDSFVPNELIPLAQGPRRDLRTIEEIQNDLWRKKGKNYPSVTGTPKESLPRKPVKSEPISTKAPTTQKKRVREESESPSEDSFIASSDEEVSKPEKFDYRAEIRAMFGRKSSGLREVDSEDDSDMEATGFEMAREEARAAKLAKLEDEEEERRLEERAREKKRRKLEYEKRKMGK
jgi:SPT2 chromatin protein